MVHSHGTGRLEIHTLRHSESRYGVQINRTTREIIRRYIKSMLRTTDNGERMQNTSTASKQPL